MSKRENMESSEEDISDLSEDELKAALGLENDPAYSGVLSDEEAQLFLAEMENEDTQTAWDDLDELLMDLPEALDQLELLLMENQESQNSSISFKKGSDGSYEDERAFQVGTISAVESLFLDILAGKVSYEAELNELRTSIGLYLGEAIVENLDGEWMIWDDSDSADYGKPVVALWTNDDYGPHLNPFEVVLILEQTRRKGILIGSINGLDQIQSGL